MNCYFCQQELEAYQNENYCVCNKHQSIVLHTVVGDAVDFVATINNKQYLIFYFFDTSTTEICTAAGYELIVKLDFIPKITPENVADKLKTYLPFL